VVDPIPESRGSQLCTCDWNGRYFHLVDTGGMVPDTRDAMEKAISINRICHSRADLVCCSRRAGGVDHVDERLARILQKSAKLCVLVRTRQTMKISLPKLCNESSGVGDAWPVSATAGLGVGEILDEIVRKLPKNVRRNSTGGYPRGGGGTPQCRQIIVH